MGAAFMIANESLPAGSTDDVDPLLELAAAKLDDLLESSLGFVQLSKIAAALDLARRRNDGERYRYLSAN